MPAKLDSIDLRILDLLQNDATLTTAEIAERINLSQSPCWRRIDKFIHEGYIKGRVALLCSDRLGFDVVVFAFVRLREKDQEARRQFEQHVIHFDEVLECYSITGNWDYAIKMVTRSLTNYNTFLREKLNRIPDIVEVHSSVSLSEIKNSTALPLSLMRTSES